MRGRPRKPDLVRGGHSKRAAPSPPPAGPTDVPEFVGLHELDDDAQEFWADLWSGPTAGRYSGADVSGLRTLTRLYDARARATKASEVRGLSQEIRLVSESFGLSPTSRLRLGWGDVDEGAAARASVPPVSEVVAERLSYSEKAPERRESVGVAERLRTEGCSFYGVAMPDNPLMRAAFGSAGIAYIMPIDGKLLMKTGRPIVSRPGWFRKFDPSDCPPKGGWENPPAWSRLLVKAQRATAPDPRALMATQPGSLNAAVQRNPGKTI